MSLLIFAVPAYLRVRPHGAIGFYFQARDWVLALVLVLCAIGAALVRDQLFHVAAPTSFYVPTSLVAIPMFLLQSTINGIPEETLVRGYVLPQLEAILRRPWLSMVLMIAVFDLLHVPGDLAQSSHVSVWTWASALIFPLQPTGLIFGYAYWRSRSLTPGIVLHTYTSLWAPWLFSLV